MIKIGKHLLVIITGLVFLALTRSPVLAADANLYFAPNSQTVDNSCYPKIDVMLDTGGQETTGVDVIIYYDKVKVKVESMAQGDLYTTYRTLTDVADQGKIVIQALADADEKFTTVAGSAENLATITFKTIAFGTANVSFDYDGQGSTTDTNVTDTEGNDILGSSVSAGSIVVQSGATCPALDSGGSDSDSDGTTATNTPAPTTYTAPEAGVTTYTVALLIGGIIFTLLSGALVLLPK